MTQRLRVDGTAAKCKLSRGCAHWRCGFLARDDGKEGFMRATWHGHVIAESEQTIELGGYQSSRPRQCAWNFCRRRARPKPTIAVPTVCSSSTSLTEPTRASARLGRTRHRGPLTPGWPTGSDFGTTSSCSTDWAAPSSRASQLTALARASRRPVGSAHRGVSRDALPPPPCDGPGAGISHRPCLRARRRGR